MRKRVFSYLLSVSVIGVAPAAPAAADLGWVSLNWEDCEPLRQNLDFSGPGQTATLVASIAGAGTPNHGHRVQVAIGWTLADAWRFEAGGCQSEAWKLSHEGASASCPAFQGERPLGLRQFAYDYTSERALLDVANTYDLFKPDPGIRNTLWQASFDHTASVAGWQDPAVGCGFAERPLCLGIVRAELLPADRPEVRIFADRYLVTWQDPGGFSHCAAVPAEATTWGRMKSAYR